MRRATGAGRSVTVGRLTFYGASWLTPCTVSGAPITAKRTSRGSVARCADMRGDARYLVLLSGAGWVRSTWESPSGCSAWRGMGALAGAGLVLFLVQAGRIAHKKKAAEISFGGTGRKHVFGGGPNFSKTYVPLPMCPAGGPNCSKTYAPRSAELRCSCRCRCRCRSRCRCRCRCRCSFPTGSNS